MKRLSSFCYDKSTLITALLLTVISFAYLFFVLIDASNCFQIEGESVKSLGTSFGYDVESVKSFYSARSREMIICYRSLSSIWDNLFALTYGFMYVAWMSFLFAPYKKRFKSLNLLPILHVLFDLLENFQLYSISNSYLANEQISSFDVKLGSTFTQLKWSCYSIVLILIVLGIVLRIISAIKKRKHKLE